VFALLGDAPAIAFAVVASFAAVAAQAEPGLGGSVTATSAYLEHGLALSQDETALAELHYGALSGVYGGVSVANVRLDRDLPTQREVAIALGIARAVNEDWVLRAAAARYVYTGSVYGLHYDYDELRVAAEYQGQWLVEVGYSPDASRYSSYSFAQHRGLLSYEISLREPLARGFSVEAGAGYYDLTDLFGIHYTAWNAGIGYARGHLELAAGYYGVSRAARDLFGSAIARNRWVATATVHFRLCACGAAP
jgi:uncharacterized protein (TIGR02001 family)